MDIVEFRNIKAACMEQGISGLAYCRQNDIPYHRWNYWSRKFRDLDSQGGEPGAFLQVLPEEDPVTHSFTAQIESPSGWRVHVTASLADILASIPV
jgi:hypothetical protein